MNIHIKSVTILRGHGTDDISIETDLPSGVYPFTGNAFVKLYVAHGLAEKYITENFPDTKFNLIDMRG